MSSQNVRQTLRDAAGGVKRNSGRERSLEQNGERDRFVAQSAFRIRLCTTDTSMRLIGHLPSETSATTFSDYLYVQGITNEVEAEKEGWAIWIHSEDECSQAKEMLA